MLYAVYGVCVPSMRQCAGSNPFRCHIHFAVILSCHFGFFGTSGDHSKQVGHIGHIGFRGVSSQLTSLGVFNRGNHLSGGEAPWGFELLAKSPADGGAVRGVRAVITPWSPGVLFTAPGRHRMARTGCSFQCRLPTASKGKSRGDICHIIDEATSL